MTIPSILDFGIVGTADDTAVLQAAIDSGVSSLLVPAQTTLNIGTVTIANNFSLYGEDDTSTIKRLDNYDLDNTSAGFQTTTMFDIIQHGIKVNFKNLTLDGNEQNQNVNTPSSTLIRFWDVVGESSDVLSINCSNVNFKNMTRSCITVKGNIYSSGHEFLNVDNCIFIDGRHGIGSGDPQSANASGFAPFYINVNDKFRVCISNNKFLFNKQISTSPFRNYAPGAIRFTRVGATNNSQGSGGLVNNNYFYGCGRSDTGFENVPNTNNGLGVVEAYTVGKDIVVSNNKFELNRSSCVRAKASVDNLVISNNIMRNCEETGVSVGPMADSVGVQTGRITIEGNLIKSCQLNAIIVTGDLTRSPSYVEDISIVGNTVSEVRNSVGSSGGNEAAIAVRQASKIIVADNIISGANYNSGVTGIKTRLCQNVSISGNKIHGTSSVGINAQNCDGGISITGNTVQDSADMGICFSQALSADFNISNNTIRDVNNAGILGSSARYFNVNGNLIFDVGGSRRGINIQCTTHTFGVINSNITNAQSPLFHTLNGNISQDNNSWNSTIQWRAAPPTSGTWAVNDIIYNTSPSSGNFIGWVCLLSGSPGYWRGFGEISL